MSAPLLPAPGHDPAADSGRWFVGPHGTGPADPAAGVPVPVCPPERLLAARVDGELDGGRAAAIDGHLDRCTACAGAARRLEALSGLLREWEAKRALVPPSRLADRILREVGAERALARRDTMRAGRRLFAAAAAVVVALSGAAWLGWNDAVAERAARSSRPDPAAVTAASASGARDRTPFRSVALGSASGLTESSLEGVLQGVDDLSRAFAGMPSGVAAVEIRPVPDEDEPGAFGLALFARAREARRTYGEDPAIFGRWLVVPGALEDLKSAHRKARHLEDRLRRLRERATVTLDPTAAGVSLTSLLVPPDRAALPGFLSSTSRVEEPASRSRGGIVLRALPEVAVPSDSTSSDRVLDLSEAVRTGRVHLFEDPLPRGDVVYARVGPGKEPILVPAGELLEGGIVDRVIARGAWLPASTDAYPVRLPCRPVARGIRRATSMPTPLGAIAGPGLRGLLAIGEDAEAVLALVDAQLRDAALDVVPAADSSVDAGSRRPSLLTLYRPSLPGASTSDRAAMLLSALPATATGFVATDPRGRLQGIERVNLPLASAPGFLRRLLAGYAAESGTRSSVDGVRIGAHVESVLAVLADRPVRLLPPVSQSPGVKVLLGEEPSTGVAFEAVVADGDSYALSSGLVPEIR
jgi:hypothetical protein